jgi:type IV pilus assembly protein PilA
MTNTLSQQPPGSSSNKALIIIVVISLLIFGCAICGILSAIAIPNFIKFQERAKQVEAKMNLKLIYAAKKAELVEKETLTTSFKDLTLESPRYSCFLSSTDKVNAKTNPVSFSDLKLAPEWVPGITGTCPACEFVAICAGTLRSSQLDVWGINSQVSLCNGEQLNAGTPCNLTPGID